MTGGRFGAFEVIAGALSGIEGVEVSSRVHASEFTSFRLGGPVSIVVRIHTPDQLAQLASKMAGMQVQAVAVGRGTNLLVSDHGFSGVVLRLGSGFESIETISGGLRAGAAAAFPAVANKAARESMTGLEFAIAIPASVGGAVRMNAGAHGSSISDVMRSAEVFSMTAGVLESRSSSDLSMAYRQTDLADSEVVCSADFALTPGNQDEIRRTMASYRQHRSRTQPSEAANAGSMFRNPPDDFAGRLIESAGLKGEKVGHAEVSERHANFFLARSGATSQNVIDLMIKVQGTVLAKHSVLLLPEIKTLGEFERIDELRRSP